MRIIDDVLDFSKIEAGRLELEATAFSLSGLVQGVLDTFRPQVLAKSLTLDSEINAGSQDALVGDPTRVRQILFNLLSNAIKFTKHGGVRVRAGTLPLGGGSTRAMLAVTDTGIGLSPEQLARLFQPFVQADSHANPTAIGFPEPRCHRVRNPEEPEPSPGWHRRCRPTGRRLSQSNSNARSRGCREAKGRAGHRGQGLCQFARPVPADCAAVHLRDAAWLCDAADEGRQYHHYLRSNANVRQIRMNAAHPAKLVTLSMGIRSAIGKATRW